MRWILRLLVVLVPLALVSGCNNEPTKPADKSGPVDSQARPKGEVPKQGKHAGPPVIND